MNVQFATKDEVKSNFFVNDLTNLVKNLEEGEAICTQCHKEASPPWRCLDCKIYLCENCQSGHIKIPVCRGHKVQSVGDDGTSLNIMLDEVVFCTKHPCEIIKFHCKTCESLICIQCKILEHDSHEAESIEDGVKKTIQRLKTWRAKLDEELKAKRQENKCLEKDVDQMKKDYNKAQQKVRQHEKKIIEKAKQEANSVVQKLTIKEKKQKEMMASWKVSTENELEKIKAQRDYLSVILEMSQGVSLMQAFKSDLQLHYKDDSVPERKDRKYKWETPNVDIDTVIVQPFVPTISYREKVVSKEINKECPEKVESTVKTSLPKPCKEKPVPNVSEKKSSKYVVLKDMDNTSLLISRDLGKLSVVTETIDIPKCGNWIPRKFAIVHSNIYIVDPVHSNIVVISMQGNYLKHITEFISPTSLVHEEGNCIIVSSLGALELYDIVKMTKSCISEGKFHDVSFENGIIVALASNPNTILVFKMQQSKTYCLTQKLTLETGNLQRVFLKSGYVYLHFPEKRQVALYDLDGKEKMKISTKSSKHTPNIAAKLCLVDEEQSMLFADWYCGLLEVHIMKNNERMITLANFPVANDAKHFEDKLLVLAGCQVHKLNLRPK